jgi:3-deoxy-7-phosphoheptulonate synthase
MARAAIAAGADGIHIEVHSAPEKALSDGAQALRPPEFAKLMDEIRKLAALMVRTITYAKQGTRL